VKKIALMVATFALLLGAFVVYFGMQAKFSFSGGDQKEPGDISTANVFSKELIKPGTGAWSKQFDRDGNLYSQFKCDYYDPQPDGTMKVRGPLIQFFLSGGQVMQIAGKDGVIRFSAGADRDMLSNSPSQPPRDGSLRDVTVQLFSSTSMNPRDLEMTMTMKNAEFDNDTYRLFTQEYVDDSGAVVHADDVPVTVAARDYAFTGSGLVLYWNDVDRKLKSLEIAHGKDLEIRNAQFEPASGQAAASAGSGDAQSTGSATGGQTAGAAAQGVAGSGTAGSGAARPAPAGTRTPLQAHRYTATFYNDVRIIQSATDYLAGDQMTVDFVPKEHGQSNSAAEGDQAATTGPAKQSAPEATATRPSGPVIHVHWTGPLKIVPTDPTAPPLPDGKAIVQLTGAPVKVHQGGAGTAAAVEMEARSLSYRTEDSNAHLAGQVSLKQIRADGLTSTVDSEALDFSRLTHEAVFTGRGRTRLPDPNDRKSVLKAAWTQSCTVKLFDLPNNQTGIEEATLQGSVLVTHPKFLLTAKKTVDLKFDSPATTPSKAGGDAQAGRDAQAGGAAAAAMSASPPLRKLTATGDANCIVHEAPGEDRQISGDMLNLRRDPGPDGKLYASQVVCNGSVRAFDGSQALTADSLQVDLLPVTDQQKSGSDLAGQAALDHMDASGNVRVSGKDGAAARADDLQVQMIDRHAHVRLSGTTDQPAVVKNKTSTLIGPVIEFSPHEQMALVEGPGSFDGLQQPKDASEKPRPVTLSWQEGASLDGKANEVIVSGAVAAGSDQAGEHESAACDRIVATLVDAAPTTAPSTETPSTQPAGQGFADGADFMKNKQIKLMSLQMDAATDEQKLAKMESYASDAAGGLVHQYDLLSRRIDIDPKQKRLEVNGAGEIFAHAPAAATQADSTGGSPQPAANGATDIGGDGNTGIYWQKQFVYDDAAHRAKIDGDITIVHMPGGDKSRQVRLEHADEVLVDLLAGDEAGQTPATQPAGKIRRVTATGGMIIRTADKTIACGEIEYDPAEQTLTCRGGQLNRVTVDDNNKVSSGSFEEAILDLKTNELKELTNLSGQGR
jgi:lipopolysaccharide export system protein LptA